MKTTLFVLLLAISCTLAADLVPTISVEREHTHLGFEKVKLNWIIENTDNSPVLLLKFGTPAEGTFQNTLTSNMFNIVSQNGVSPVYTGILMKRDLSPKKENYVIIPGNSVISGEIILSDAYHFTEDGVYTIQLVASRSNILNSYPLVSNEIQITISGSTPFEHQESNNLAVTYTSCTSNEESIVKSAISGAVSASNGAVDYLASGCTPSYNTWFGDYSSPRYSTVYSNFQAIYSALASNNFGINCGCNQAGTYAYVYPTDPTKTIHLCPVFWDASTKSTGVYNTQPGTLTHEMSHFNAVAGTEDYQYGTAGCKSLASNDPAKAIANADNYEYFQESGPSC